MHKLIQGDCMEKLPALTEHSIDMILCDLPYGTTQNKWDSVIPFEKLWIEYLRVLKPFGVIALHASQPFTSALVMSNPKMYRHEWIWIKNRGSNFANTVREPMKEHESVLIFSYGKWTYNKQLQERTGMGLSAIGKSNSRGGFCSTSNYGNGNVERMSAILSELRVPTSHQRFNCEVGLHPTQKPVKLAEYLITTYTNEGDTVLDNCAGSGTTGIAARNLKRNSVLIEKESEYCDVIVKRFKNNNVQT